MKKKHNFVGLFKCFLGVISFFVYRFVNLNISGENISSNVHNVHQKINYPQEVFQGSLQMWVFFESDEV